MPASLKKAKTGLHPDIAGPANYEVRRAHAGTLPGFAGAATQGDGPHGRGESMLPSSGNATNNVHGRCRKCTSQPKRQGQVHHGITPSLGRQRKGEERHARVPLQKRKHQRKRWQAALAQAKGQSQHPAIVTKGGLRSGGQALSQPEQASRDNRPPHIGRPGKRGAMITEIQSQTGRPAVESPK